MSTFNTHLKGCKIADIRTLKRGDTIRVKLARTHSWIETANKQEKRPEIMGTFVAEVLDGDIGDECVGISPVGGIASFSHEPYIAISDDGDEAWAFDYLEKIK